MLYKRDAEEQVRDLARYYPIITITGPRQSGKTTLARMCFHDYLYCSLEDPDTREMAEQDPRGFLLRYPSHVIIDEVQRVPTLLSYLQTIVDEKKIKADFILTGSHQPQLMQSVSQSLAGRTGFIRLYPFSQSELSRNEAGSTPFDLCFQGFYPAIYSENIPPGIFYPNYYQTYLERDVRQLINLKNSRQFQIFIRLLAGRCGQLINYNALAADSGVSSTTIKEWISILEASHIIHTLNPYYKNIRKRLVKSPKLYICDTGLLCNIIGINNSEQLFHDPLRGSIFENMIVMDILKEFYNRGKQVEMTFLRDSKGFEIDLLIEQGDKLQLVEIKSASTWNKDFSVNLLKGKKLFPEKVELYIIYAGSESFQVDGIQVLSAENLYRILK